MTQRSAIATRLALGFVVAASFAAPVRAADDGYDNVFSSVLTAAGVLDTKRTAPIEYRERPPLALPPKAGVVPPVGARSARPASWPNDPDIIKQRKADEEARAPMEDGFARTRNGPLSKAELMKGRVAGTDAQNVAPGDCSGFANNNRSCLLLSPNELRAQGERYRASNGDEPKDVVTAGTEPEREYLTQPPKGYLKATKTVKATVAAPDIKMDESSPKSMVYYRGKPDGE